MIKRHTISFRHAFDGILYAFSTQPNFRIHTLATILVTFLGFYFHISLEHWLFLIFTIVWVLTAEMMNTSLEATVDLLSPQLHPSAKIAKDTAAGMVLISAFGAIAIGLIIFVPYF